MAYGAAPAGAQPNRGSGGADGGGGGLIAIAVLLLVEVLIELATLGYDLSQAGAGYLLDALGFSYSHFVDAPVGFFGYDTALTVALLALVVGAFNRGRWVRPAAVVLLATNAYGSAAQLINQLTGAHSRDTFAEPFGHLLLNLGLIAGIVIAIAVAAIVGATRTPRPAAAFPGYLPPQGYPYGGGAVPHGAVPGTPVFGGPAVGGPVPGAAAPQGLPAGPAAAAPAAPPAYGSVPTPPAAPHSAPAPADAPPAYPSAPPAPPAS